MVFLGLESGETTQIKSNKKIMKWRTNNMEEKRNEKEIQKLKRIIVEILFMIGVYLVGCIYFMVDFMKQSWMSLAYFIMFVWVSLYALVFIIAFLLMPFIWALQARLEEASQPLQDEEIIESIIFELGRIMNSLEGDPTSQGEVLESIEYFQRKLTRLNNNGRIDKIEK